MMLSHSVGLNGKNNSSDALSVQKLINLAMAGKNWKNIGVDGKCGAKSIEAIRQVQRDIVKMVKPDGIISPTGKTIKTLSDYTLKKVKSKDKPAKQVQSYFISHEEQRQLIVNLNLYEGSIDHMYLDSNRFVTAGVGHLIKDKEAAAALPFRVRKTNLAATQDQIIAEFKKQSQYHLEV